MIRPLLLSAFTTSVLAGLAACGTGSWRWSQRLSVNWALIYSVANRVSITNALSNATPTVLQDGTLLGFRVDEDPDDQVIDAYLSVWQSQFGLAWTFD